MRFSTVFLFSLAFAPFTTTIKIYTCASMKLNQHLNLDPSTLSLQKFVHPTDKEDRVDFLHAHFAQPDIYDDNQNHFPVLFTRTPAVTREQKATETREMTALGLQLTMATQRKRQEAIKEQITEAQGVQAKATEDSLLAHMVRFTTTSPAVLDVTDLVLKNVQQINREWSLKEAQAKIRMRHIGEDIENVGAINKDMRNRMQRNFQPLANPNKRPERTLDARRRRADVESKVDSQKEQSCRGKGCSRSRKGGGDRRGRGRPRKLGHVKSEGAKKPVCRRTKVADTSKAGISVGGLNQKNDANTERHRGYAERQTKSDIDDKRDSETPLISARSPVLTHSQDHAVLSFVMTHQERKQTEDKKRVVKAVINAKRAHDTIMDEFYRITSNPNMDRQAQREALNRFSDASVERRQQRKKVKEAGKAVRKRGGTIKTMGLLKSRLLEQMEQASSPQPESSPQRRVKRAAKRWAVSEAPERSVRILAAPRDVTVVAKGQSSNESKGKNTKRTVGKRKRTS